MSMLPRTGPVLVNHHIWPQEIRSQINILGTRLRIMHGTCTTEQFEKVLESIRPHPNPYFNFIDEISIYANQITRLPQLPPQIKIFEISSNPLREILGFFHEGLEKIHIYAAHIRSLPEFPSTLKILSLMNIPELREIPRLPKETVYLTLNKLGIRKLPAFDLRQRQDGSVAVSGRNIDLYNLNLDTLELPDTIEEADLFKINVRDKIFRYPYTVMHTLKMSKVNIEEIAELRCVIYKLLLLNVPNLERITAFLPGMISILTINDAKIKTLPNIPHGLKQIQITHTNLHTLQPLPESVMSIYLDDNDLRDVPVLPIRYDTVGISIEGNKLTKFPRFRPVTTDPKIQFLQLDNNKIAEIPDSIFQYAQQLHLQNNLITTIPRTVLTGKNGFIDLRGCPLRAPFDEMYDVYQTLRDEGRLNDANAGLKQQITTFWKNYNARGNIKKTAKNMIAMRSLSRNTRLPEEGVLPIIASGVGPAQTTRGRFNLNKTLKRLKANYNAKGHHIRPNENPNVNGNAIAMRRMFHETRPQTEGEPNNFGSALRGLYNEQEGGRTRRRRHSKRA